MKKIIGLCLICILAVTLLSCKSKQSAGDSIKNIISDIDRTQITSVNFINGYPKFDEVYNGKDAVNQTLDYLASIPVLYETVTPASEEEDGDFIIGGSSEKIFFYNEKGEKLLTVDGLYHGYEGADYGVPTGNIFIYGKLIPEVSQIQYVVPSEYVEKIIDYMHQNAKQ